MLINSGAEIIYKSGFDKQISEAFYAPIDEPMLKFGMFGLIAGTVLSTLLSLGVAGIIGVCAFIAICELAPRPFASVLLAAVRLLASIPSVVFGLIGVMLVVPSIESAFITIDMQIEYLEFFQMTGRNLLSSVIVISFMIMPMVIALSSDALKEAPLSLKETGMAFGMSHIRVIWRICLPFARPGIVAGLILAAGRGIGEAIAVSMVCGGVGMIPILSNGMAALLTPILPLSSAIVNKSEAMSVPAVESALFACGAILLAMGAALSATARAFMRRSARNG
ncbi:MAG: ABC transporter permease subunit [Clostridiales bacterium]|nr:ABC transporter permease subunit [Clostridiales bacterium]